MPKKRSGKKFFTFKLGKQETRVSPPGDASEERVENSVPQPTPGGHHNDRKPAPDIVVSANDSTGSASLSSPTEHHSGTSQTESGAPVNPAADSAKPKAFNFMQKAKAGGITEPKSEEIGKTATTPSITPVSQVHLQVEEGKKKPSLVPGSDGEHKLQEKYETRSRAINFYEKQMLDYLAPAMKDFIARAEFLFVATADHYGECDCTSKFGKPGFIRVLGDNYVMYPEFRGNGVYANAGNISENPHIALLMIDFYRDTVGLHVNGKARVIENDDIRQYAEILPADVIDEINQEGKKCPERWVMVEVEEAYIQCSKHIPLLKKAEKAIDWGTDSVAAKGGDYFQLQGIPLYQRIGGDKAMEIAVDLFYRKVLQDELVGKFFEDVDIDGQRLKQKNFLAMAFGGPYQYSGTDLRKAHKPLVDNLGLTDVHFDRVLQLLKESLEELSLSDKEQSEMMNILSSARDDVLNR